MAQNATPDNKQALSDVRTAARQHRNAASPDAKRSTREALHRAITLAVQAGVKQAAIADAAGLSRAQVSRVSRGATSGRTHLPTAEHLVNTLPVDDIIARYRVGSTTVQLGREYGCSSSTIITILNRHDVPRRNGRQIELPVADDELVRRYLHERTEIQDIAAELGVKPNLISRRLAAAGVAVPRGHRRMDLPDAEIVARHKAGEPVLKIARSYGVSHPTIKRRIREDRSRKSA